MHFVYIPILFQPRKTCMSFIQSLVRGLEAEKFSNEEIIEHFESSRR